MSSRVRSRVADFQRELATEKAKYIVHARTWPKQEMTCSSKPQCGKTKAGSCNRAARFGDIKCLMLVGVLCLCAYKQMYCTAPYPIVIQEAREVCTSELTKYKDMCSTMSKRVRSIHICVHVCMWLHALRCNLCIIKSCCCMCFTLLRVSCCM